VLKRYERVVVPEMNLGQLALLLRAEYLVDIVGYNQVRGLPFRAAELADVLHGVITEVTNATEGSGEATASEHRREERARSGASAEPTDMTEVLR